MFIGFFFFTRFLFIVSMVFIFGYVFGNFSKKPVLARITKIACVVVVVATIAGNIFLMRNLFARHHYHGGPFMEDRCWYYEDSLHRR